MATIAVQTKPDETLHTHPGRPALANDIVERVPVVRMPGPNRLDMHEVGLPDAA